MAAAVVPSIAGALTSTILIYAFATYLDTSSRHMRRQLYLASEQLDGDDTSAKMPRYTPPPLPLREHIKARWNEQVTGATNAVRDADYEGFGQKIGSYASTSWDKMKQATKDATA